MKQYPGTVLAVSGDTAGSPLARFDDMLRLTGGVTLAQLCEMTGLEASTIQNWVKRGWVPRPEGKRYGERHIARVFLINALRGALQLESIIELLRYVNGNLDDTADDLLPDRELYELLCRTLQCADDQTEEAAIEQALRENGAWGEAAVAKLKQALAVMLPAYLSAQAKRRAEEAFRKL